MIIKNERKHNIELTARQIRNILNAIVVYKDNDDLSEADKSIVSELFDRLVLVNEMAEALQHYDEIKELYEQRLLVMNQ